MGNNQKGSELISFIAEFLQGKRVLILGYGREGRSTLNLIVKTGIKADLTIADKNEASLNVYELISKNHCRVLSGPDYLNTINHYDIVIKSPGISLKDVDYDKSRITSQTDLFLKVYGSRTVGVTGTKGKSTTSSLIYHILKSVFPDTVFGGNIGIPLFDLADRIGENSKIVCELSSHQLEFTNHSPHIAVLLNLFQEHLDHYKSFLDYQKAKLNIALYQKPRDYFIYHSEDQNLQLLLKSHEQIKSNKLPMSINQDPINTNGIPAAIIEGKLSSNLPGEHNRLNVKIAAASSFLMGAGLSDIEAALKTFNPLEHRLEFVGIFNDKKFYNDSISTIPESAIAAVESLKPVYTLILGGFNRGIDYNNLAEYILNSDTRSIITTGPAGATIYRLLIDKGFTQAEIEGSHTGSNNRILIHKDAFDDAVAEAIKNTPAGSTCLLSPAASSYNEFKNFEYRGNRFKELVSAQ